MFKQQTTWTDDEVSTLKRLAGSGATAGMMAKAIGNGRTRNMIIGKVRRLGLSLTSGETGGSTRKRLHPAEEAGSKPLKAVKPVAPKAVAIKPQGGGLNPQRIPDFKPPTIIPDREGAGPTVVDLETGMCRAPVGSAVGADQQHCGRQTDPAPKGSRGGIGGFETYCEPCAKRLNKPVPSRAR